MALSRWTWLSWVYGALVAGAVVYGLVGIPIQVSDSYGNLVDVTHGSLWSILNAQFHQRAYLRPFLWANLRIVYDLSNGAYFEWFRGWHAAQVALLVALFLRLVRPRTVSDAAAVPLGLAALIGIHTFGGTVREAFPINTFMTILLCTFAAADLALGPPRWWRDYAAAALFVFAALTVESGLLVTVVFVAAWLGGARGISGRGALGQCALLIGYFALRFLVLDVGAPGLEERSSGVGFSVLEPDELAATFGSNPLPFYLYNVLSSGLSVLFSEPRAGVFQLTGSLLSGDVKVWSLVNVAASTFSTLLIAATIWWRRDRWRAWRLERADQLVLVFIAVLAANSVMSYAYTKDVILSPAGAFYAVVLSVSAAQILQVLAVQMMRPQAMMPQTMMPQTAMPPTAMPQVAVPPMITPWSASSLRTFTTAAVAVCLIGLSSAWAFRSLGQHLALRHAGEVTRDDWAYIDQWLERQDDMRRAPDAIALKQHLQDDAIRRHPARPTIVAGWVEWFER
jgi:hypothetical protein